MLPENHYGHNLRGNFEAALSRLDNSSTRQILQASLNKPQIITATSETDLLAEMRQRMLAVQSILPTWLNYPEFLYELARPGSPDFMLSLVAHLRDEDPGLVGAITHSVNLINLPEIYSRADLIEPDAIDRLAYDFSDRNTGLHNAAIPLIGIAAAAGQPVQEYINPFYFIHSGILGAADEVGKNFGGPAQDGAEFLERMRLLFTASGSSQPAWDILTANGAFINRVGCPMHRWTRSFYKIYGEELAGSYGELMLKRITK
jgi:hypothetical protein